jgi:hypothetical protein
VKTYAHSVQFYISSSFSPVDIRERFEVDGAVVEGALSFFAVFDGHGG